ncbi:2-succinyl-5-enolpyruvyl-6-hydroxy-3-cyclohexene-1-carboxylic-acid synthase [Fulvivirgaceae bacterium BMA10]|uniref:2-succinyl-5-enolpyruvyl-6-hydroxy-3-cyclohexene-1-carboxylate synthase n=1 Tax=Splendidivirga corallicola TaxID=3051826 RepID=A0ABT8KSQ4_9BACT|nr:2-succinyl-5-enolpyruvyl-6-hydroxy-3-cyclohexene-1-carboxylic-acid synthase [Fulvivirgaceae bacterium BMA10]
MILQSIINIAEICSQKGISEAILSPGSRCAPLTLAFVRHPKINTRTIGDERSAGFIGLGLALKSKTPTVLVCTSGSAAYNYAPAVAEAYFQQIPMVIFTADRPPEWIDQLDGQTIRQQQIYGRHVKKSYELPVDQEHPDAQWHVNRIVNEAINESKSFPPGPVHINAPFREPFYPSTDEAFKFDQDIRIFEEESCTAKLSESQIELFSKKLGNKRILILAGQDTLNIKLLEHLNEFSQKHHVPVIGDVISNCHSADNIIQHQDAFLAVRSNDFRKNLSPDILITFGKSVISKQLKIFLRELDIDEHWHLQIAGEVADTFQQLTKIIRVAPEVFFQEIKSKSSGNEASHTYLMHWKQSNETAGKTFSETFFNQEFSEFEAVKELMSTLPSNSDLHLANSMPVRYANYVGLKDKSIEVYANRGTSGIDGSNSTALGTALGTKRITTLITGDMAFFYDRNAFWNNYIPANLRIVILNNHGGGIFGLIKGPSQQPELAEYFETEQPLFAESLSKEYGLDYYHCKTRGELISYLPSFFKMGTKAKILEIETDKNINKRIFATFKSNIQKTYGV